MSSWYYATGAERRGPLSLPALAALVAKGQVRAETLVWSPGQGDWRPAGQVTELRQTLRGRGPDRAFTKPGATAAAPVSGLHGRTIKAPATTGEPSAAGRSANDAQALRSLHLWYLVMLGVATVVGIILVVLWIAVPRVGPLLSLVFFTPFCVASSALWLMLVGRLWNVIQDGDGEARTTPGKAVGFLFIPLFNLYWAFEALVGLSSDLFDYARRRGVPASSTRGLAFATCVAMFVPGISLIVLVLMPVLMTQLKETACSILEWKQTQES